MDILHENCIYCGEQIEKGEFYNISLITLTNSGKMIPVEGWKSAHRKCFEASVLPPAYVVKCYYKQVWTSVKKDWVIVPILKREEKKLDFDKVYLIKGQVHEFYGESPYVAPNTYLVQLRGKTEEECEKRRVGQ